MKILITAAMFTVMALTPASAKMMACTGENMAKSTTAMTAMMEGPGKMAVAKEMSKANMAMSKGDMRGACKSYMQAQKMAAMKPKGAM